MFGGTGSGFTFGKPTTPATTGFTFGSTPATTAAAAPFSFNLGQSTAPTQPAGATQTLFSGLGGATSGFTLGQASTAAPATGFSLGTSAAPTPALGTNLFGGAATSAPTGGASLFGTTQPAAPTSTAPSTGFSFGIAAPASTAAAPTLAFGTPLIGAATAQATAPAAPSLFSTTTAAPSLFGTTTTAAPSLFGSTTTAAPSLFGSTTTAAPSLFGSTTTAAPSLFGSTTTAAPSLFGSTTTAAPSLFAAATPVVTTTPAAAATPTVKFSFGGAPATSASQGQPTTGILKLGASTATTTPAQTGFTFGVPATSAPVTTLTTLSGVTTSTTATAAMTYGQLEEAINKWTIELDKQEKVFLQQATQVNAWDRMLIDNGEKIANLNNESERLRLDQQRLDHELDFIRAQQRELEELLGVLEANADAVPVSSYQQHADLEREHTYEMAESIDAQLKRMATDLKEIIDRVNSANTTLDQDDPIYQITKILNAHMDSLQWIDQNTAQLSRKVDEISKLMDVQRKEHERSFRLAYH